MVISFLTFTFMTTIVLKFLIKFMQDKRKLMKIMKPGKNKANVSKIVDLL